MPYLPSDVTLFDVIDRLTKPTEYVRGVVERLHDCRREHGSAFVRLGTLSTGAAPNYRVEPQWNGTVEEIGEDRFYMDFNGKSHKRMEWGWFELKSENWSSKYCSLDEATALLGSLRNSKRKSA